MRLALLGDLVALALAPLLLVGVIHRVKSLWVGVMACSLATATLWNEVASRKPDSPSSP